MAQICDNLHVGSVIDAKDNNIEFIWGMEPLVINVAEEINNPNATYKFALFDDHREINYLHVLQVWKKIHDIYKTVPKSRPVLIHCQAGRCRSVATVLYLIMVEHNCTVNDALAKFGSGYSTDGVRREYMNILYEME